MKNSSYYRTLHVLFKIYCTFFLFKKTERTFILKETIKIELTYCILILASTFFCTVGDKRIVTNTVTWGARKNKNHVPSLNTSLCHVAGGVGTKACIRSLPFCPLMTHWVLPHVHKMDWSGGSS